MGGDCSPSLAPYAWCQETGFREPAHPPNCQSSPSHASQSHPHPSHQPPHPSQAWLSGECGSPSPGTMVKPTARGAVFAFGPVISHPSLPAGTRLPDSGMGLILVSSLPRGLCAPGPLVWAVFWLSHRASPAHPLAPEHRESWAGLLIALSAPWCSHPHFPRSQCHREVLRGVWGGVWDWSGRLPGQAGLPWC